MVLGVVEELDAHPVTGNAPAVSAAHLYLWIPLPLLRAW